MKKLMTKHFSKWVSKQRISENELKITLAELQEGNFEANLGGHLYKKRIRFEGKGKRGSGRTIICYKRGDRAIFIYGFAKNHITSYPLPLGKNCATRKLKTFKELSKILLKLSEEDLEIAIKNGDFTEVK